jgi:hypothetical protein
MATRLRSVNPANDSGENSVGMRASMGQKQEARSKKQEARSKKQEARSKQ